MTICNQFMTKLQFIVKFLYIMVLSVIWHNGCHDGKQTGNMNVN